MSSPFDDSEDGTTSGGTSTQRESKECGSLERVNTCINDGVRDTGTYLCCLGHRHILQSVPTESLGIDGDAEDSRSKTTNVSPQYSARCCV